MSRERLYRTEAIVLKRSDLGEADRLLTLYTPNRGKLRAVAKGVRRPTSRKAGHVELFSHSQLLLARGRNLDLITQAELIEPFRPIREDLLRLTYASYAAELVDQFIEEETENRAVFDLLRAMLSWLAAGDDPVLAARLFELKLLGYAGYHPQLYRCVECGRDLAPEANFFSAELGGVACPACFAFPSSERGKANPLSLNALKVMRFIQGHDYAEVRALRLAPATLAEVESTLYRYITHLLERNLRSVEFLSELSAIGNQPSPVRHG